MSREFFLLVKHFIFLKYSQNENDWTVIVRDENSSFQINYEVLNLTICQCYQI